MNDEDLRQLIDVPAWIWDIPMDWSNSNPRLKEFHKYLRRQERQSAAYIRRLEAYLQRQTKKETPRERERE